MEKFIPYEKLSKKKKRAKSENPKAYNRKKAQKWTNDSSFCASFFVSIARRENL